MTTYGDVIGKQWLMVIDVGRAEKIGAVARNTVNSKT